jgi:hypothetical protein
VTIETILTILLAAGILAAAAVFKLTFYGLMWLVSKAVGHEVLPWRTRRPVTPPAHALPREPLTTRAGRIAQGAGALSVAVAATVWNWMDRIATALMIGFAALGAWLEPGVVSGLAWTRRASRDAYRWMAPRVATASKRAGKHSYDKLDRLGSWWVDRATPSILETGEAARDVIVPATEGHVDVSSFARTSLIVLDERDPTKVS